MIGLGGGLDQGAYNGPVDNEWVLALNMGSSVPGYQARGEEGAKECPLVVDKSLCCPSFHRLTPSRVVARRATPPTRRCARA